MSNKHRGRSVDNVNKWRNYQAASDMEGYQGTDRNDYLMMAFEPDAADQFAENKILDLSQFPAAGTLTSVMAAKLIRGKCNSAFRENPHLFECVVNGTVLTGNKMAAHFMRQVYELYVAKANGAGKKTANWHFGRQLYTCVATATGVQDRKSAWHYWESWDDQKRNGNKAAMPHSQNDMVHYFKHVLLQWAKNISEHDERLKKAQEVATTTATLNATHK